MSATTASTSAPAATQAQIDANRANAQLSTGPKTEAGRLKASLNALQSGLTATRLYIRPDQIEEYQSFYNGLHEQLMPQGMMQCQFFDQILHASWNIQRCTQLEAHVQEEALSAGLPDAILDDQLCRKIDRIWRYKRMHETSLRQAIAEYRKLKTEELFRNETNFTAKEPDITDTQTVVKAVNKINLESSRMKLNELRAELESTLMPADASRLRNSDMLSKMTRAA